MMQARSAGWRALGAALLIFAATVAVFAPRDAAAQTKPCTLAGFEEAVFSTGGVFTFDCASDTTLNINASYGFNNVPANGSITLDGGNRLTLKGAGSSFLFSLGNPPGNRSLTLRNMTIDGFVQAAQNGSVVLVAPTNSLTVDNVTFRNNAATSGRKGGVIYGHGPVTVTNSTFINNRSEGASDAGGGAIAVDQLARSLSVSNSTFISNTAPMGGAISTTVTTTITSSSFISNTATRVPAPGEDISSVGGAITLGEVFKGTFVLTSASFQGNHARATGGTDGTTGRNGVARGGAIYVGLNATGAMTVTSSAFYGNGAIASGGIGTAVAGNGNAEGGAIFHRENNFPLTILSSSFISNVADGKGANRQPAGNGGGSGSAKGGALLSYAQLTRITNSTFALNLAHGRSDSGNTSIGSGTAYGGAIHLGGAANATIRYSTIYSNSVNFNQPAAGGTANGGGIDNSGGGTSAILTGTIVAKNTIAGSGTPNNCYQTANFQTGGHNLSDVPGCNFTGTGDVQNATNPNLGPPANNGGPTVGSSASPGVLLTMLPGPGSPAIDTGGTSATGCPSVDQRGATRPAGPQCDKGAVEVGGALPVTPTPTPTNTPTPSPGTPTPPPSISLVRVPVAWVNGSADAALVGGW